MAFIVLVLSGFVVATFYGTKDVDEPSWRIGVRVGCLVFAVLFLVVAIANYHDLEWSPAD
jgi:hypothetical protein